MTLISVKIGVLLKTFEHTFPIHGKWQVIPLSGGCAGYGRSVLQRSKLIHCANGFISIHMPEIMSASFSS